MTPADSQTTYGFRVFLSYAREDRALVERMDGILRELALHPVWDRDIHPGSPFTDAIREAIASVHLFLPLITERSQHRPWVHQETGYAMGINIPVLPIAVDTVPGEMIAQLQAVVVKPDLSDLADRLREMNLERIVFPAHGVLPTVSVVDYPEQRATVMANHAGRLADLGRYGRVRHCGVLGSFSVPDRDPSARIWDYRDGIHARTRYFREQMRNERRALERHARQCGCDLIFDPTVEKLNQVGPFVRQARLTVLCDFLRSMPDEQVRVVLSPQAAEGNVIIVGDWFYAESRSPRVGQGHVQTVFQSHAPTVLDRLRRFDREFEELQRASGLTANASRRAAIERIRAVLRELPSFDEPVGYDCSEPT